MTLEITSSLVHKFTNCHSDCLMLKLQLPHIQGFLDDGLILMLNFPHPSGNSVESVLVSLQTIY